MRTMILAVALALLLAAPTAAAGWPCTCDPNPITDLLSCLKDGPRCPVDFGPLDPRDWPCTCDPQPTPI